MKKTRCQLIKIFLVFYPINYNYFKLIRNSLHCSAQCSLTSNCSAFSFDDQTKSCQMGSNLQLVNQDPAVSTDPLLSVQSFNGDGINIYIFIKHAQGVKIDNFYYFCFLHFVKIFKQ